MSCPVCIESYNKVSHKLVQCQYCDWEVCRECLQQYLLSRVEDPHCMSCKKKWTREVFDEHVSVTFRTKTYKLHRETILMEREKALLPATQDEAKRILRVRELVAERVALQNKLVALQVEIEREQLGWGTGATTSREPAVKRTFTIHCPVEQCRGYVNGEDWKCGTCSAAVCKECFEVVETESGWGPTCGRPHVCNPDSVKTAKTLRSETRSCPTCSTLIYKSSGCNQMWCTQCHTAFDWKTGQVCTDVLHNPHFYEWQQRTGGVPRNLGDIPCGGMPDIYRVGHYLNRFLPANNEWIRKVYKVHQSVMHAQNYEMPMLRTNNVADMNSDLRVSYLINEISEEDMKKKLQHRDKQAAKKQEFYDVYEMYVHTMVDMFNNLLGGMVKDSAGVQAWLVEADKLREYANDIFEKIGKRYKNVPARINGWGISTVVNQGTATAVA